MFCPDDGSALESLKVNSFYGWQIEIQRCPECQGLWFDSMELFPIDSREAVRIDTQKNTVSGVDSTGRPCPRCHQPLSDFKDTDFPDKTGIHICPNCQGMWLHHGVFTEFKQYQQQKKLALDNEIKAQAAETQAKLDNQTPLEKFSNFLMTPYYGSPDSARVEGIGRSASSVLGLILRSLLR